MEIIKQGTPENKNIIHFGLSPKDREKGRLDKIGCFSNWSALCGNGSFHNYYTKQKNLVTCEYCLKLIKDNNEVKNV